MEQYISKSALLAEIERLRKNFKLISVASPSRETTLENVAKVALCRQILSFIDTLEVKEGGFCTEVYKYIDEHFNVYDDGNQTLQNKDKKSLIGRADFENIAKHFFELGMQISNKAQKGK